MGRADPTVLAVEYVPLDRATDEQLQRMISGDLADNTGGGWTVTRAVRFAYDGNGVAVTREWAEEHRPHEEPRDAH